MISVIIQFADAGCSNRPSVVEKTCLVSRKICHGLAAREEVYGHYAGQTCHVIVAAASYFVRDVLIATKKLPERQLWLLYIKI